MAKRKAKTRKQQKLSSVREEFNGLKGKRWLGGIVLGALLTLSYNYATKVGEVRAQAAENTAGIKATQEQVVLLRTQVRENKDEIKREVWFLREQLAATREDLLEAIEK